MTFIVITLAFLIERFFDCSHLRPWGWFSNYLRFFQQKNYNSYILLFAIILPPIIIVLFFEWLLTGWLFNILKLIFSLGILLYCLGPENLWVKVFSIISHQNEPKHALVNIEHSFNIEPLDKSKSFHESLTRAIFIAGNQKIFAVCFWFIFLGPAGALLYRLIERCYSQGSLLEVSQHALIIRRILDWLPIRFYTFFCALVGNFNRVIPQWKKGFMSDLNFNETYICNCGFAALDIDQSHFISEDGSMEKEALSLLDRIYVIGLLAIIVILLIML